MLSYSHNEICGSLVFGGPGITRSRGDGPGESGGRDSAALEHQRIREIGHEGHHHSPRVRLERTRPKPKKKVVGSGVVVLLRKVATAATEVINKYQGIELWMSLHGFHAPTILRNVKPSILDS